MRLAPLSILSLCVILVNILNQVKCQSDFQDVNISAVMESLVTGHNSMVRPNYGGTGVKVGITMYILSVDSLSEDKMTFSFSAYFRQFWRDPRLAYNRRPGLDKIVVTDDKYIGLLWKPDTFFVNAKSLTTANQFLRILPSGDVLHSQLMSVTAGCPMNLQHFPMDTQLCYLEIESYLCYSWLQMADISYQWNDGQVHSLQISSDVSLPEFKVLGHKLKTIEASLSTGNYSRLSAEMLFVRSSAYEVMQIYVPAGIIVILSWISFLVRDNFNARLGIGLTTLLAIVILMAISRASRPKISYVTAEDLFTGSCFIFVTVSTIDCTISSLIGATLKSKIPSAVRKLWRFIYPVAFVIFNITYWEIYNNLTKDEVEDLVPKY